MGEVSAEQKGNRYRTLISASVDQMGIVEAVAHQNGEEFTSMHICRPFWECRGEGPVNSPSALFSMGANKPAQRRTNTQRRARDYYRMPLGEAKLWKGSEWNASATLIVWEYQEGKAAKISGRPAHLWRVGHRDSAQ